jgi:hypothetical protein
VLPNHKTVLLILVIVVVALLSSPLAHAQVAQDSLKAKAPAKKWYESIQLRGYTQVRYNRLFETNEDLGCESCDRSWGKNGGFFLRRVRLIFFGQVNERVYFYIQPDFASSASSTGLHFGQLRDAYFDVGLTKDNSFRVRIGQSKIPYGFENMQSSQNRLPLDRADATNSAVSNERDLGAFFYWAPVKTRQLFSSLVADGLKGSGDYGVFALGAYNGQTANRPELNNSLHVVSRLSYPFSIGNQVIEPSIQGYTGRFVIPTDQLSSGTKTTGDRNYLDQRVAASLVVYPKPFGIMAEYTIGKGPEFNTATDSIETQDLTGGFVMLNYRIKIKDQNIFPYSRIQYYEGGKKHERDARSYKVNELESGIEWQPVKNFELVVAYTISSRRYEDKQNPDNEQKGNLMRIQAQLNF